MRGICLTHGQRAIVDDEDYEWLNQSLWYLSCAGYAMRSTPRLNGVCQSPTKIRMHRLIVGARSGELVDHLNRNKLDNRRRNLRIVTWQESNTNKPVRSDNTSGKVGLSFYSYRNTWRGVVRRNGIRHEKRAKSRVKVEQWLAAHQVELPPV